MFLKAAKKEYIPALDNSLLYLFSDQSAFSLLINNVNTKAVKPHNVTLINFCLKEVLELKASSK